MSKMTFGVPSPTDLWGYSDHRGNGSRRLVDELFSAWREAQTAATLAQLEWRRRNPWPA
jgi:hypothetical protein